MPFVGGNFQSADTIFNGAVIIVWLSSIPIGPREFSVVAEVFPVVVAVEVLGRIIGIQIGVEPG